MRLKSKYLLYLVALAFLDMVVPIPVLGIILIYVLFSQPAWFIDAAKEVYGDV